MSFPKSICRLAVQSATGAMPWVSAGMLSQSIKSIQSIELVCQFSNYMYQLIVTQFDYISLMLITQMGLGGASHSHERQLSFRSTLTLSGWNQE